MRLMLGPGSGFYPGSNPIDNSPIQGQIGGQPMVAINDSYSGVDDNGQPETASFQASGDNFSPPIFLIIPTTCTFGFRSGTFGATEGQRTFVTVNGTSVSTGLIGGGGQ